MEIKKRRHFADAFKREAVDRARTSGLTIIEVAEELGLHETVRATIEALFDEELAAFLGRLRYGRGGRAKGIATAVASGSLSEPSAGRP